MAQHERYQESPAIAELKRAIEDAIPNVVIGTVRKDRSRHTAGLAMDIMLDSRIEDQKSKADKIIEVLIEMHPTLRWYDMIYVDWDGKKPFYFHIPGHPLYAGKQLQKNPTSKAIGEAHVNHIHVDWCNYKMKASDPECVYDWPPEALVANFAEIFRENFAGGSRSYERPIYW